jgi:ankyrin repeat protein
MIKSFKNNSVNFLCLAMLSWPVFAQTEDQVTDFAKAAKFDDVSTVTALLAKGVSPNTVDTRGNPMLLLAIRDKSTKVTEILINDKRTDVDLSNKYGETPLMMASIDGDLPVVKTLVLQKKAMVNHIGWTPLHYACTKGNLEVAQFLIANGAMVDGLSPGNTTALMMAVQSGNEQLVKLLLDKGADLQLRNANGLSAIDIADIYDKLGISEGLRSRWQKLYKQPYPGPLKAKGAKS